MDRGGRAPPASHSQHAAARKHKCIREFSASLFSGSFPFHFQIPPRDLPLCKYPLPFPTVVGRADFPSWPILPGANCVSDGKLQMFFSAFPAPPPEPQARNTTTEIWLWKEQEPFLVQDHFYFPCFINFSVCLVSHIHADREFTPTAESGQHLPEPTGCHRWSCRLCHAPDQQTHPSSTWFNPGRREQDALLPLLHLPTTPFVQLSWTTDFPRLPWTRNLGHRASRRSSTSCSFPLL